MELSTFSTGGPIPPKVMKRHWSVWYRSVFTHVGHNRTVLTIIGRNRTTLTSTDQSRTVLEAMEMKEEQWKIVVEELPPSKPPDLKLQVTASGFSPYEKTTRQCNWFKFHCYNLEDKVVLETGVMIGYRERGHNR
ncbi:hypothetical protein V8G54_005542 [Vigna mungo]|uniref:Uncharacterized protein n=1 Tax=Vigna mungo TaxID=3915 RepID=A0AAQ3NZF4_VIGMU